MRRNPQGAVDEQLRVARMNTVPAFDIEICEGAHYSVEIDGLVVERFLAPVTRNVGLAPRGACSAFVHEDGKAIEQKKRLSVRRAGDHWPHNALGEAVREPLEEILAAAPEGRYVLTCGMSSFDLWLGPVAD